MNTSTYSFGSASGLPVWPTLRSWGLLACLAGGPAFLHGQVFVTNGYNGSGTLLEYSLSGTLLSSNFGSTTSPWGIALAGNSVFVTNVGSGSISGAIDVGTGSGGGALVTGLTYPTALAVAGGTMFVNDNGTIKQYSLSGTLQNSSLITGLSSGTGVTHLAVIGNGLFVADLGAGKIGRYDLVTSTWNSAFISESGVSAIAAAGGNLYVANYNSNRVDVFDPVTGSPMSTLVPSTVCPRDLAIAGSTLYVLGGAGGGTVGTYNLTTGATFNASLITGLSDSAQLAVVAVPEPATSAFLGGLAVLVMAGIRRWILAGRACGVMDSE